MTNPNTVVARQDSGAGTGTRTERLSAVPRAGGERAVCLPPKPLTVEEEDAWREAERLNPLGSKLVPLGRRHWQDGGVDAA